MKDKYPKDDEFYLKPFENHEITQVLKGDKVCSWTFKRPNSMVFWCQITSQYGLVSVIGDIGPMVFGHGPLDPIQAIIWVSNMTLGSQYFVEKASTGMRGRDNGVLLFSVEKTKEKLEEELQELDIDDYGESYKEALQAGIDCYTTRDGLPGICEIYDAMADVDSNAVDDFHGASDIDPQALYCGAAIKSLYMKLETTSVLSKDKNTRS